MKLTAILATLALGFTAACSSSYDDTSAADSYTYSDDASYTDDTEFETDGPEMQRLALDIVWNDMSLSDQQEMCDGLDMLGVDLAVQAVLAGSNTEDSPFMFDEYVVADWLTEHVLMTAAESWAAPRPVDDVTLAFPARVIGYYLPPLDEIPGEFHRGTGDAAAWHKVADRLSVGSPIGDASPDRGTNHDPDLIRRHLGACLGSYEPRHEHKIAGVAWLLSLWFTETPDPKEGT